MPDAGKVIFTEGDAPGTPGSGTVGLYAKTDGKLYIKDDAGTETDLTATGGGGSSLPVDDTTSLAQDPADNTKQVRLDVEGVTTATTRVLTVPDADLTIVGTVTTQTLTNKTIDADNNTVSNIGSSEVKAELITGLTDDGSPDGAADYVMTYDASATAFKKVLLDDLPSSGGGFSGDSDSYEADEGSDYTTTSTTFVDVDATNLSLTITTTGGNVMVGYSGTVRIDTVGAHVHLNVDVDGSVVAADDGIVSMRSTGVTINSMSFVYLVTGLSAGSHTFKLQWKVSSSTATLYAGAGTSNNDIHPQFWVQELS